MKLVDEIKRYLLTILLCFIAIMSVPTMIVHAEEAEEDPTPDEVLEYVLESGDTEYLIEHQDLFPSTMVSELLKANSEDWERMLKDEDIKMINSSYPTTNCLSRSSGTYNGPSGKETYYNLNMSRCVEIMRSMGYDEKEYPVWEREDGCKMFGRYIMVDGCKMFGRYIMVAAELGSRPKGTILECSLGEAIVVDTGTFAYSNPTQLDIAVNW